MLERNREGANELLRILEEQEAVLQFDSFNNQDALKLGIILSEVTKDTPAPLSLRVFLGDVIAFQYAMEGDAETRFGWTYRKYQLIKKTGHSSMHGKVRAMFLGELMDLAKNEAEYGFGCGGFPIIVKDKGIIGAVAVSGLPDPADHLYVVEALEKMIGVKAPVIPAEINEEWIN